MAWWATRGAAGPAQSGGNDRSRTNGEIPENRSGAVALRQVNMELVPGSARYPTCNFNLTRRNNVEYPEDRPLGTALGMEQPHSPAAWACPGRANEPGGGVAGSRRSLRTVFCLQDSMAPDQP